MIRSCFSFGFFIFFANGGAQPNPKSIPLNPDVYSSEIFEGLSSGKMRISKASHYFAQIGDHRNAISMGNEGIIEFGFDTLTEADVEYFQTFEARPAVDVIVKRAEEAQVVMINEAHHNAQHRIFTHNLLEDFYHMGFRYLALEALFDQSRLPPEIRDTSLQERKYPLNGPFTGFYVSEPRMSNMIRTALELGYELIAYDQAGKDRELYAAQKIGAVFDEDPDAKMIIHCGWYHLLETVDAKGREWLAKKLKARTGIDPFTVYQDILSERSYGVESPFYQLMCFDQTKVFVNEKGELYNGHQDFEAFDVLVYHPRTRYVHNRPHWLLRPYSQLVEIKNIAIEYPCLVKGYKSTDGTEAVPLDIIEKKFAGDPSFLVLPPGKFRIEIVNKTGQSQTQSVTVK